MTHLVLTGFMGTGKTAVGRYLAQQLGRPFVDMDEEIESRVGKPIPRIFAEDGEATFRAMEAALCQELSTRQGLVIATGGGALVDPTNHALMLGSGTVVCLGCQVDEILQRLRRPGSPSRPLLDVPDPRTQMERLLEARREAYEAVPWQVDTTGLSVAQAAARVMAIARATTLSVGHPGGRYPIHIGRGLLGHVGSALRAAGIAAGSRVVVVTNPVVAALYAGQVESSLQLAGFEPSLCCISDGEQHKTLATVQALYADFLSAGLDRSGTVLSLGGGVTGDLAGFATATFMRGVRLAQVPTTLLAMTDASVGGKTGANHLRVKNLVGAFKQPALVLIDPDVLATLPTVEMRCGTAEVIKHATIADPDLFAQLEGQAGAYPTWWGEDGTRWLARSLAVKIHIVQQDPFEEHRRAVLNLGHTVGHALEQLSGFAMHHGEAVSIGMVAAAQIAVELALANPSVAERIQHMLGAWELPVRCPPYSSSAIWEAIGQDKKRRGGGVRWVLPSAIGKVEVVDSVPPHVVRRVLHRMGARNKA